MGNAWNATVVHIPDETNMGTEEHLILCNDATTTCGYVSLGTLVPNSRDWHEKKWLLNFSHFKTS